MIPHVRKAVALLGVALRSPWPPAGATTAAAVGRHHDRRRTTTAAGGRHHAAGGADHRAGGAVDATHRRLGQLPRERAAGGDLRRPLEAKGVKINRKLNIGNRETYYPALENGELDLLPEYTNSLLSLRAHG